MLRRVIEPRVGASILAHLHPERLQAGMDQRQGAPMEEENPLPRVPPARSIKRYTFKTLCVGRTKAFKLPPTASTMPGFNFALEAKAAFLLKTQGCCFRCLARDHRASACRDPIH